MRILYYNWVDYQDRQGRGGGVSIYLKALMDGLGSESAIAPVFLASGLAHDLRPAAPRWQRMGGKGRAACCYEIVNARPIAPAHAQFASAEQITHAPTEAVFFDFITRTGPYDVIHFHNLEGLPASVLALRERWPQTRVVLSLHNYYPFCPQVNLWQNEARHCDDFLEGRACATCLPLRANPGAVRLSYALERRLTRLGMGPGTAFFDRGFRPALRQGWAGLRRLLGRHRAGTRTPGGAAAPATAETARQAHALGARRHLMSALINRHCDAVLCVSDRVRQLAGAHGIHDALLHTSYIGTHQAAKWHQTAPRPAFLGADGTLRLAYLGYMRADKGFFFLLDALEALPPTMARRLHLTIAARRGDGTAMARLEALRSRLASLRHLDGYNHAGLDALLGDIDMGLVPVLWEDNLPQVAIEMHARHIPLLCSDRGGARELGNCPALTFRAGDTADFTRALAAVLDGQLRPADYWQSARTPMDMPTHLRHLQDLYTRCA
ncbi:MAG: glycosyltransferase [Pararhodobacter sp.]